ncbi:hypothetical protein [Caballeronia sp. GAFFF2]
MNGYLCFMESGDIFENYPDARDAKCKIE